MGQRGIQQRLVRKMDIGKNRAPLLDCSGGRRPSDRFLQFVVIQLAAAAVTQDPSGGVSAAEIRKPFRNGMLGLPQHVAMQENHGDKIERPVSFELASTASRARPEL